MTKRILTLLTLLLALALCLGATAFATDTAHTHCICGDLGAVGNHECADSPAWKGIPAMPTAGGYYYLTTDVTISSTWQPADGTYLCLNGHTLTYSNAEVSGSVIEVKEDVNLTICDCRTTGKITGGKGAETRGGGVHINAKGTFNMYGGSISGNTARNGGGVCVEETGWFWMYGGSITGNTSSDTGGGVHNENSIAMYGGEISGNTSTNSSGGGVWVKTHQIITVGGTARITGNKASGKTNNLHLAYTQYSAAKLSAASSIAEGAEIGISLDPGISSEEVWTYSGTMHSDYFFSDDPADGRVTGKITYPPHTHCVCGGDANVGDHTDHGEAVTFTRWESKPTTSGHYYLASDVTIDGTWNLKADAVLCLNGYELKLKDGSTGSVIWFDNNKLTLCDCKGTGTITGGNTEKYGGGIFVQGNSILTMYGGIITNNSAPSDGGGIYLKDNSQFIMYGGKITGNSATSGGGVYVKDSVSFTMHGGEISGNSASGNGGGIWTKKNITITNGKITENTSGNSGGGIYMKETANVTMTGGEISKNTASINGGGIFINNSLKSDTNTGLVRDLSISGTAKLEKNTAQSGGGIYIENGFVYMEAGSVTTNNATSKGGGIHMQKGRLDVLGTASVTGNTAAQDGGGVFMGDTSIFKLEGTAAVSSNTASFGGGVYVGKNGDFRMSGGTVTANTAMGGPAGSKNKPGEGGGVWTQGKTNLSGGIITGNKLQDRMSTNEPPRGGGVYVSESCSYINLTGPVTIADNEINNLYLCVSRKVGFDTYPTAEKAPTKVGVTLADDYATEKVFSTGGAKYVDRFYSDDTDYGVVVDDSGMNLRLASLVTVSFDSDGGTSIAPIRVVPGGTITLPEPPTMPNFTFGGWYYPDGSSFDPDKPVTDDITLTARWISNNYSITFHANGGTVDSAINGYTYGIVTTLPAASREHYRFDGWYASSDLAGSPVTTIGATEIGDREYWAKWSPVSYPVTLVTDGGTLAAPLTSYTYGTGAALPAASRDHYTFDGWYTSPDFTGAPVTAIFPGEAGAKTFWAKWTYIPGFIEAAPMPTPETPSAGSGLFIPFILPFSDVYASDWYYGDVFFVWQQGLMNGVGGGKFSPEDTLNRAMLVTTLYRLAGEPAVSAANTFSDLPEGEWYTAPMKWAVATGIIRGYGDGTCRPLDAISREEAVAVLRRYAGTGASGDAAGYICSSWAKADVAWAVKSGLLDGLDMTDLTQDADRAEIAALLARFAR